MQTLLKLNIGCGPTGQIDGFINIDNSKAALLGRYPNIKKLLFYTKLLSKEKYEHSWDNVAYMDASKKLRFSTSSVDKIYSSHFLEHIPKEKAESTLRECHRVLKKGGCFRLVIPDLLWHSKEYIRSTETILNNNEDKYTREHHDKFLSSIYGAYLDKKRYGLLHCYMYDIPTIFCLLKETGFINIRSFQYQEGQDPELKLHDNRPLDSIHIECVK